MGGNQRPGERRRPSNPMQGDDMFRTRNQQRQNAPFFKLNADDGEDFWSDLDGRHAQHRQQLKWLLVGFAVIVVLGLIIDTVLIGFALILLIPITVEFFMIRRTRSRVKIPDYRQPEPAEIDLEQP
ncbi:MAG: hypothetical protein RIB65_08935 [Ilumatobacter fluminis]|uniref:hypothetical protein n=1 Tax=Ilumatobacter fluminis TaxID=467091 RepID=UPI0032ECACEE